MASCIKCGRRIPDGEKYCISCKETKDHKKKFWGKVGAGIVFVISAVVYAATKGRVKISK